MTPPGVKAILGYDVAPGMTVEEYEAWLWDVHVPDLLANPHLDRMVLNTVTRTVTSTSDGTPIAEDPMTFYRIAELHFADDAALADYLAWFREHPIPPQRSPAGRTAFRFYVITDSVVAERPLPE